MTENVSEGLIDANVIRYVPLVAPAELERELPLRDESYSTTGVARKTIQGIVSGSDPRLAVVVGPCSIHDCDAALEYAGRLGSLATAVQDELCLVMRTYLEKPRSALGWEGLISDPDLDGSRRVEKGLVAARKLLMGITASGVPVATEFMETDTPQYLDGLVSWAAIGARTSLSPMHRWMASGLSMPVGFKNDLSGDVDFAIGGITRARAENTFRGVSKEGVPCIIETRGNKYCHLVLRGANGGDNYHAQAVEDAQARLAGAGLDPVVIVDCSHGNSGKDHERQPEIFEAVLRQRIDGNAGIIGLMLESNLYGGKQSLESSSLSGGHQELRYGVSITDACIGWDDTERLILEAYNDLKGIGKA